MSVVPLVTSRVLPIVLDGGRGPSCVRVGPRPSPRRRCRHVASSVLLPECEDLLTGNDLNVWLFRLPILCMGAVNIDGMGAMGYWSVR
jgi:hypothetical protein